MLQWVVSIVWVTTLVLEWFLHRLGGGFVLFCRYIKMRKTLREGWNKDFKGKKLIEYEISECGECVAYFAFALPCRVVLLQRSVAGVVSWARRVTFIRAAANKRVTSAPDQPPADLRGNPANAIERRFHIISPLNPRRALNMGRGPGRVAHPLNRSRLWLFASSRYKHTSCVRRGRQWL